METPGECAKAEILGYSFRNPDLLDEALTTPSCRMEHPDVCDNQRLEFLGDAVLELLATDKIFAEDDDESEGRLTVRRTHMVSTAALCEAAMRLGLRERLYRNSKAEEIPPNSKTLADAVEAIIGAAWLDGGFEGAKTVFDTLALREHEGEMGAAGNPKGALQERSQAMRPPRHPVYTVLKTAGQAPQPIFTVQVTVEGMGAATARAGNRREAETLAAAKLLSMV